MKMDIRQILSLLPHRFPIILVDRVLELDEGKRIVTLKNVSANEPVFTGHFPDLPVMPGVYILEAMAQSAAILTIYSSSLGKGGSQGIYYFAGIDNARFKRPVVPGDQLRMEVVMERNLRGIGKFSARAYVDDVLACEANLMCAYRENAPVSQPGQEAS
jgi:3-hydroxyacyl-[acyl-carrier-protein] dehydratase